MKNKRFKKIFWWQSICLLLLFSYVPLHGQVSYDPIPIFEAYENGQHQAFRDVLALLSYDQDNIIPTIQKGTLIDFQDASFDLDNPQQALQYYYRHKDEIQYYSEWGLFLRNDLPLPNLPYAIIEHYKDPEHFIKKARILHRHILNKSFSKAAQLCSELTLLETIHAQRILVESLKHLANTNPSCSRLSKLVATLISKLIPVADQFCFKAIDESLRLLNCSEKQIVKIERRINDTRQSILQLTLQEMIDEYQTSPYIIHKKVKKYANHFEISERFFDQSVDFYGKLLSLTKQEYVTDEDELLNILLSSKHPKALYYIASKWYQYVRQNHPRHKYYLNLLNGIIDHQIQINTPKSEAHNTNNPFESNIQQKSFLAYWLNNYIHYEWSDEVSLFINKNIMKEDRQNLIRLYKNLNKNDIDFALSSYKKLILNDPILLAEVDKIYSKKLLNYNKQLPSRKYKYLIQLSRLVNYCKLNGYKYQLSGEIERLATELLHAQGIKESLRLENEIVSQLKLGDITAFEIWSIIHSGYSQVKFSATRITNLFYTRHLDEILRSPKQFQLYLKKANLFRNFGDHGSSKYYLDRLTSQKQHLDKEMTTLSRLVLDNDILSSIDYISTYRNNANINLSKVNLDKLLRTPLELSVKELQSIEINQPKVLNKLINRYNTRFNPIEQYAVLQWFNFQLPVDGFSFIVKLINSNSTVINRDGVEIKVQDIATEIATLMSSSENFNHTNLENDQYNLLNKMLDDNLKQIVESEQLSYATLNDILNSPFYSANLRSNILAGIPKIYPLRNIVHLNLNPKLNLEEVKYLLPQINSKNALSYLLSISDVEQNDEMVLFLIEYAESMDANRAGIFFNDLFKKSWFNQYISNSVTATDNKNKIHRLLSNYYLQSEEILSAFEEDQTVLNIIKIELSGKSFQESIEKTLDAFVDNDIKRRTIQNMIVQINYDEISIILSYFDQIVQIGGIDLFKFINEDFGIPIENHTDPGVITELSNNLQTMSQKDLYIHYLTKIGFNLYNSNNVLNLPKVYQVVSEDLVRPYVGTGGIVRDVYVYGIIKLLEFEFNTSLGFHEKLNESQQFYKYTSSARAQAWQTFLIGHIKKAS